MEMSYLKLEIYCGDVIDVETFMFYVNMTALNYRYGRGAENAVRCAPTVDEC